MPRLKIINQPSTFQERQTLLALRSHQARTQQPIKGLKQLPQMVGIAPKDKKWLKLKALKYILLEDHDHRIKKSILKNPFPFLIRYITSFFKKKTFTRQDDLFFYGIKTLTEFKKRMNHKRLIVGFSYCQKPHECPSGRFNDQCMRDLNHPICSQCDIGTLSTLLPSQSSIVIIPTVHHIGNYFFDLQPEKPLFLITACEMTLTMFADFGNMLGIEGIGVRLDGRICNTMKAFELSEKGIKPGLTVLTSPTYQTLITLLQELQAGASDKKAYSPLQDRKGEDEAL